MKSSRMILLPIILSAFISCSKKVDIIPANSTTIATTQVASPGSVSNIGTPFIITNVSSKINPLNPNILPLITYHPKTNAGYELVMIDNGILNGSTPINAFHFVVVNLDNNSYKIVKILNSSNGTEVTSSVGRITRYVFGMDKKLYVATEGSDGGGGHIIEYDPDLQTAWDLGKPFKNGGRYLDIYSLQVGTDNALYGGSFGGNGDVMTFRYNYNNNFEVDQQPLDNFSRYVTYISGDATYTYASCGESSWNLYAINRSTKQKTLLLSSGVNSRIELNTYTDAPYAHLINTHYKLQNNTASSLGAYNTPSTNQLAYSPYSINDISNININWDSYNKKLSYSLNSGVQNSITISDVVNDTYRTGAGVWLNNKLYISSANHSLLSALDNNNHFQLLGNTGISIYNIATGNASDNNIYIGGYPKGNLYSFNTQQTWNLDGSNIASMSTPAIKQTNPQFLARTQDANGTTDQGPMFIASLAVTKNNYLIYSGDNDRITASSGRTLEMGYYKNGSYNNIQLSALANYQFSSMCLTYDSSKAIIAATNSMGGNGKIYVYDPASNSIISSFNFPTNNPGKIITFDNDNIAGVYDDVLYLFNIKTGNISFKQALGNGQSIFSIIKTPNNKIDIVHMYLQATHFKVLTFSFTKNADNYSANSISSGEFSDAENDENTKPDNLIIGSHPENNSYDLYIAGLKSIYQISNLQ